MKLVAALQTLQIQTAKESPSRQRTFSNTQDDDCSDPSQRACLRCLMPWRELLSAPSVSSGSRVEVKVGHTWEPNSKLEKLSCKQWKMVCLRAAFIGDGRFMKGAAESLPAALVSCPVAVQTDIVRGTPPFFTLDIVRGTLGSRRPMVPPELKPLWEHHLGRGFTATLTSG